LLLADHRVTAHDDNNYALRGTLVGVDKSMLLNGF
jgi:hypothetical protein